MNRLRGLILAALLALSLTVAACGGPAPSPHASGGTTPSATTTSTPKASGWG